MGFSQRQRKRGKIRALGNVSMAPNIIKGRTDFVVISQTNRFYRTQNAVIEGLINVLSETIKWLESVRGKVSIRGITLA